MPPEKHALLSASSSHKWLHCPGSAKLEATFPDTASDYAKEGTLAHSMAELKLQKKFTVMSQSTYTRRFNKIKKDPLYNKEINNCTDTYLEFITESVMSYENKPHIAIERKIDFSDYAPEGFGTSDCTIVGADTLHVVDYKHGKGKFVSADNNPQLMLYALGAYKLFSSIYDIQKVKMSIIQPRLDNIDTFELPAADLLNWGEETVKPAAQKAYDGMEEYRVGEWCEKGFCKARAVCQARKDFYSAIIDFKNAVLLPTLSNDEIGDVLQKAQGMKKWLDELEKYALSQLLEGNPVKGFKAVEGRSLRAFTDAEQAFRTLTAKGYDEALLYERKPLSLTGIEKMLGKTKFNELLGGYVLKPQGKPTLVPDSDNRPVFQNTSAINDFKEIGE